MKKVTLLAASEFLLRHSFIELTARERAEGLLDRGSFRELLGPFDRMVSPWLLRQGIVPQSDDGVIVARGQFDGEETVVLAIEGAFQGGSAGEVSGAKMVAALDLVREDAEKGKPIRVILLMESGGVRLQEANLGLEAIAEMNSSLIEVRRLVPVVGVIAGMVGCFGGMSITAALCSYLVMTREARLGLNGPEVIEEQSGIEEFDARDRQLIWSVDGGEYRVAAGFADELVEDDLDSIKNSIRELFRRGIPKNPRSAQVNEYLALLEKVDLSKQLDGAGVLKCWGAGEK
jgi:malonate decarboxylase beta subunit